MKKFFLILLLCSPILVLSINKKADIYSVNDTYFGKRTVNGVRFVRGSISGINKNDRIITVLMNGGDRADVFIPKQAKFFLKLRSELGGENKKIAGDYFNRIMAGNIIDAELSGNTVFADKILIYDLENFNY